MNKKEKLLQVFTEEANEIIEELDRLAMELEEGGDSALLINDIFRGVHTLKGSANSFGFNRLGEYVHHNEEDFLYCVVIRDVRSAGSRVDAGDSGHRFPQLSVVQKILRSDSRISAIT